MFKRIIHISLLISTLCAYTTLHAEDNGPYVEALYSIQNVRFDGRDFIPRSFSGTAGWWIRNGFGIEVSGDFLSDEGEDRGADGDEDSEEQLSVSGLSLKLRSSLGVALRLASPELEGMRAFFVIGAVRYTLEERANGVGVVTDDFTGTRVSLGWSKRLQRNPKLSITGEYRNYFAVDDVKLDGFTFGLRYDF